MTVEPLLYCPLSETLDEVTSRTALRFGVGIMLGSITSPWLGLGVLGLWAVLSPHVGGPQDPLARSLDGASGFVGLALGRLVR